jgi:hypothetical protein
MESTESSIFIPEGELFVPTEHARGPWDPNALHGGAIAALMTSAFERVLGGHELPIGRLSFEMLRPIPLAPLSLTTRIVRAGRRVLELAGELRSGEDLLICRASALRVQAVPNDLPIDLLSTHMDEEMRGPEEAELRRFALDDPNRNSFAASAMEMRWLHEPTLHGSAQVWMRLRHPLEPGEELTPLARLAATADFGNGVSAVLPFDRFIFINADLSIHLHRPPRGEWIGLDARTRLHGGGTGLAESVLHDVYGTVGRAFQTLVVQQR